MSNPEILYKNLFTSGTVTSSATDLPDRDVSNIADYRTYTKWQTDGGLDPFYVTVDLGSAASADTLGIVGHDLGTTLANISIEASSDNFVADTTVALASFVPTDDKLIYKKFTTLSKRYWRLKLFAWSIAPSIGVLFLGVRLTFPQQMQDSGNWDSTTHQVISTTQRSQNGNILGSVIDYKQRSFTAVWRFLDVSFVDGTIFRDFWDNNATLLKPFFFAWDVANKPNEVYYVSLPNNVTQKFPQKLIYKHVSIPMVGVVE